jgi:branched-chain amino acid transport system substrate-binding protein
MKSKVVISNPIIDILQLWTAGANVASGIHGMCWLYNDPRNGPSDQKFTAAIVAKTGRPPSFVAWAGWTAMPGMLAAIEQAKSTEPGKIVQAPESIRFEEAGMPSYYREWDHQYLNRGLVVTVREPITDKGDYVSILAEVPEKPDGFDALFGRKSETKCALGEI